MTEFENVNNEELIRQIKDGQKKVQPRINKIRLNKNFFLGFILLIVIVFLANYVYRYFGYYTISEQTIHWHAHLTITDHGQNVPIAPSIGLLEEVAHPSNLHTHAADGIIHMEIKGPVKARDIMLGRFFEVRMKDFGKPNVLMVNGMVNSDMERYIMKNKDEIEIIYK